MQTPSLDVADRDHSPYALINYQFEVNSRMLQQPLRTTSVVTPNQRQYMANDEVGLELKAACQQAAGKISGLVYCNDGLHSRLLICDPTSIKLGKNSTMVPALRKATTGDITSLLQPLDKDEFFEQINTSAMVYDCAEQSPVATDAEGRELWELIYKWRLGLNTIRACLDS